MLLRQAMIGYLSMALISLLPRGTGAAAAPRSRWNPTDGDNPHWKMSITNLSAASLSTLPYADFYLTVLPGKFVPRAICHARILDINSITPSNNSPHPLPSTDWIDCFLPDFHPNSNVTNITITTPISAQSNHTGVSFRWLHLPGGGAVLRVQSNMSFASGGEFEKALDSSVGVWPPPRHLGKSNRRLGVEGSGNYGVTVLKELARDRAGDIANSGGSLFIWQQGTFNIASKDISVEQDYTGQTNLTTVVDWVGICDGAGGCHENVKR